MIDFREKTEIFNSFFANHCSLINSNSSLSSEITKKTKNFLCPVRISTENILQIINNLDSHKVDGHSEINNRVLKIDCQIFFTSLV